MNSVRINWPTYLLLTLFSSGTLSTEGNSDEAITGNVPRKNSFEFIIKRKTPTTPAQKEKDVLEYISNSSSTLDVTLPNHQNADEVTTDLYITGTGTPLYDWTSGAIFDEQMTQAVTKSTILRSVQEPNITNTAVRSNVSTSNPVTRSNTVNVFSANKAMNESPADSLEYDSTLKGVTEIYPTRTTSSKPRGLFFSIIRNTVTPKLSTATISSQVPLTSRKTLTLITLRPPSTSSRRSSLTTTGSITASPTVKTSKTSMGTVLKASTVIPKSPPRASSLTQVTMASSSHNPKNAANLPRNFKSGNSFIIMNVLASTTPAMEKYNITTPSNTFVTTDESEQTSTARDDGLLLLPAHPVKTFWARNWYWFLIGFLLIVFVFLIPGFICQVYLSGGCGKEGNRSKGEVGIIHGKMKRLCCFSISGRQKAMHEKERTKSDSGYERSSSRESESKAIESAESTQCHASSLPEVDHRYKTPEHHKKEIARSISDDATVIVIPDPMGSIPVDRLNKNDDFTLNKFEANRNYAERAPGEQDVNSSIHSASDIRLNIGNEAIIKSNGVTQPMPTCDQFEMVIKAHEKMRATKPHHPDRRKTRKQEELPNNVVAPASRYRTEVKRASRSRPVKPSASKRRKEDKRADSTKKLSKSTRSIIEAAKGLDEILEAITNLTHEYPIPEVSVQKSSTSVPKPLKETHLNRTNDPHNPSKTRTKRRRKEHRKRGKTTENKDGRNRSPRERRKRKSKKGKESEGNKKISEERKKVPTLVKEEPISQNKVKDERRRLRLERDLKKLQRYHNKHSQKSGDS